MNQPGYRIRLRTVYPFILSLSVGFTAVLCAISFVTTEDRHRPALLVPLILLFSVAYFLYRAGLSWIRISKDGKEIVAVPSWYGRNLGSEHPLVGQIVPGAELLFCRKSAYGGFNGYYIILRAPNNTDQVLWSAESGMSRRSSERAANEIRALHQLDVRLIRQVIGEQGLEETDWTPESDKILWHNIKLMIGPALFPFLGVAVRRLTSNPREIALVGILLWISGIAILWYVYRTHEVSKEQSLSLAGFVWTLQFVGFYVVTVLATNAFLHR